MAQLVKSLGYTWEGRRFDFSLEFFIDLMDSVSNKNDYQEYFLGVKAAGA